MPSVLIAEDDPVFQALLKQVLSMHDYQVYTASNGREALRLLEKQVVDAVLSDIEMPLLDGLELCRRIKMSEWSWMPVVLITGLKNRETMKAGLEAGASYFLTKPPDLEMLRVILHSCLTESQHQRHLLQEMSTLRNTARLFLQGSCQLREPREARELGQYLALMFPEPEQAIMGLWELLINAIEHGNLQIGYQEKTKFLKEFNLEQEVVRRLATPPYCQRYVSVDFNRTETQVRLLICDEGEGFDHTPFLEFDPQRMFDNHGKGIAMARLFSFDEVKYLGKGNQVEVVSYAKP